MREKRGLTGGLKINTTYRVPPTIMEENGAITSHKLTFKTVPVLGPLEKEKNTATPLSESSISDSSDDSARELQDKAWESTPKSSFLRYLGCFRIFQSGLDSKVDPILSQELNSYKATPLIIRPGSKR